MTEQYTPEQLNALVHEHQQLLAENQKLKNHALLTEHEALKDLLNVYKTNGIKVTLPDKFNGDFVKTNCFANWKNVSLG